MPIYIEEISSEVTVIEGELSLTTEQMEKLTARILERLEQQQYEREQTYKAIRLRPQFAPSLMIEGLATVQFKS